MANFTGMLRPNEIFGSIFNMIISQEVFSDNVAHNYSLVDKARVDGSMYGDTKLYYATDVLGSYAWGKDSDTNILQLHRPKDPKCQAIYLDTFRQIALTVDNYLTKRAWATEGAFTTFNSVMLGWVRETKRIIDSTTYNVYIGTTSAEGATQNIEFPISEAIESAGVTGLDAIKLEAMEIGRHLADLFVQLKDNSRDFNDYGYMRSYSEGAIKVIWNSEVYNKIRKVDLPTIFHNEGIVEKFDQDVLPARFFGTINTEGNTTPSTNTTIRSLIEKDYGDKHLFPGDLLPGSTQYEANETYTVDSDIACKILIKYPPFMSAFEVGTSFFNPKSLTENHYLTWGRNTLDYLKNYPFITVHLD